MKINKYLFIIILIVILCILYYCFYNKTIENLESEEESTEITERQSALQKLIDEFSGTVRQQMKDMIFSKTNESKKEINDALQKNEELRNVVDSENTSDENLRQKIRNLIDTIEKDIQSVEATADFNVKRGISIEIDEEDKIRSIVNKYIT
jgi:RNase adaptor protein for sRNA GlmZ degradation